MKTLKDYPTRGGGSSPGATPLPTPLQGIVEERICCLIIIAVANVSWGIKDNMQPTLWHKSGHLILLAIRDGVNQFIGEHYHLRVLCNYERIYTDMLTSHCSVKF